MVLGSKKPVYGPPEYKTLSLLSKNCQDVSDALLSRVRLSSIDTVFISSAPTLIYCDLTLETLLEPSDIVSATSNSPKVL